MLRSEFCAPAPDPVRVSVLVRSLEGWVNRGLLDDARVAGELAVRQALHDMASGGESRDRTTAAIFLAKRLELIEGLGPEVERQRKRLMGMSARELAREVRRLCEALEIEPWPSA